MSGLNREEHRIGLFEGNSTWRINSTTWELKIEVFKWVEGETSFFGGKGRSTTARRLTSGGILPGKGRIPPFILFFFLAFAFVGLVGFQILKERRAASADISVKEFELQNVRQELKDQVKLVHERERERNVAQTKLLEIDQATQKAQDSLRAKDSELQNVRAEYDRTVENFRQLKKIVKQKDEEIVQIREKLQEYSFQKAKESAEQINNNKKNHNNAMESTLESTKAEEHKPADEAGLVDRKGMQEIEERSTKDTDVFALEKEMDERSKPKPDVLNEGESKMDKIANTKKEESSNPGDLQDEEAEEQDSADTRGLDEKELEASQEEEQHEVSNLELDIQTGNHADTDAQRAERAVDA
ncbi:unnamed protein product [Calypogeia fissa]